LRFNGTSHSRPVDAEADAGGVLSPVGFNENPAGSFSGIISSSSYITLPKSGRNLCAT
jgi:hypothetical protein